MITHIKLKKSLHLRHKIFGVLTILCICIVRLKNIYPSEHLLNQSVKVLPQISGLRIWCTSKKFELNENEINLRIFQRVFKSL